MSKRHRILVVDDDSLNLSIMEEILEDHYTLLMTTTGEECLDLARSFRPDLVLLDIMLPGIDGYETCRRLRQDPALRFIKVILVSAKVQLDERLEGYESEADDYMTKPFDPDELLAKIRVLLRLHYTEEIEQFKGQFLDLLAHETRTPLTGILSPAQLLRDLEEIDGAERRDLAEMIVTSARSLLKLVQGAVELCAFKAGRVQLETQKVDLGALIGELREELEPVAGNKSITLRIRDPRAVPVNGDKNRLKYALRIILDNAIEHGDPASYVELRIQENAEDVVVEIENEGDIVAEEDLPYVFQAFQVRDVSHHSKGVGVDLALAREIALAQGGNVECRASTGRSMIFSLVLPITTRGAEEPDPSDETCGLQEEPEVVAEIQRGLEGIRR